MRKHKNPLTLYDKEKILKDNLGKQANDKLSIFLSLILRPGGGPFQQDTQALYGALNECIGHP
jgi:hypothetical protein